MRRIFLILALLLLITAVPVIGEENHMLYHSDFSSSTDGWYARSAGGARIKTTAEGALAVSGRSDNWHSPGRDFALKQGVRYEISVDVRQSDAPQAKFMISVAHSLAGMESYENLGSATVKSGEWTTVTGSYTAGDFDRFVLYVETSDAPKAGFEIRNFTLASGDPLFAEETSIPSLKEVYKDQFDFGTAVTYSELFSPERMAFYASQFNIMTPGNEMKPDFILDAFKSAQLAREDETAVAVRFDACKPLLDFAKANGIKVHGHVLVWHQQTPEAFFHEGYSPAKPYVTREVLLARLDNYVRQIMTYMEENYPGVVVSWDVVNEAIDDGNGKLRDSKWLSIVGEDYVARAFEIARKHAPEGTLLFYNDYNTAMLIKQMGILSLLKDLMAEGNIDGYGFQMHHDVGFPSSLQIAESVRRIAEMGLKLRVSELDVTIPDTSEASYERQAKYYAQVMNTLKLYSDQLLAVQVWGVTDDLSWRASQYPLLFDGKAQPKPAFWAVVDPASAL